MLNQKQLATYGTLFLNRFRSVEEPLHGVADRKEPRCRLEQVGVGIVERDPPLHQQ